jgi:DNA repair exonuclease SbcCD ATPase subunit
VPSHVDEETERLYSLPLDRFTSERDALARKLRDDGDKAAADAVKALRKPTVSAWAINQVARKERMKVRSLLVAGEKLRKAHGEVLSGGQPAAVAEATEAERNAIIHLVTSAEKALSEAGHSASQSTLDRIATTLRAAAVEDEGRVLLERGRLQHDLDPTGFGPPVPVATAARGAKARDGKATRDGRKRQQAAQEKVRALRAEVSELTKAASDADARVATARQELRAAETESRAARRKVERAASRLEAAERELAQLRRR